MAPLLPRFEVVAGPFVSWARGVGSYKSVWLEALSVETY